MFGADEGRGLERDTLRDTVVTLAIGDVCRTIAALASVSLDPPHCPEEERRGGQVGVLTVG